MSGMTQTSSDSETVAKSLSMSASASWGPVSTSISASLSSSTTVTHQFEATEQQTRYETHEYTGPSTGSTTIIRWQLYDTVTLYDTSLALLSQVTTAQQPEVVRSYARPHPEAAAAAAASALPAATRNSLLSVLDRLPRAADPAS
jgi:hypothetical protein